jgi:hypothetical protein
MGGLGSGRPRSRPALSQCRLLDVRELADAKGLRQPIGEIIWRDARRDTLRGLLAYSLVTYSLRAQRAGLFGLFYLYWPELEGEWQLDFVEVTRRGGLPPQARCPTISCDRSVRRLYAPVGATSFGCRHCQHLVYRHLTGRPRPAQLAALAAEVAAAGQGGPSPTDEHLRDLEPQERRLACLRLAAAGLSLRAIAPRLGCSKSSVGRMLAAGPGGIDLRALYDERKQRGLDELRSREGLSAVGTAAGNASVVPERRLLFREAGAVEILRRKGDDSLCIQRLAERAQRRRSLEMRPYLGRGS